MKRLALILPLSISLFGLSACDQLGIETPAKIAQAKIADGKAIGGGCRQAMQALEDCYALNPRASKAAIFDGWKEMDGYMRDNKIEGIAPAVANASSDAASDGGDGTNADTGTSTSTSTSDKPSKDDKMVAKSTKDAGKSGGKDASKDGSKAADKSR